jgi:hypothetical protein
MKKTGARSEKDVHLDAQNASDIFASKNAERIESDIAQFHSNVKEVEMTEETRDVIEMARQYCEDTKYFLEKKDYVTAFGCINYAHGLIDAYRKKWRD